MMYVFCQPSIGSIVRAPSCIFAILMVLWCCFFHTSVYASTQTTANRALSTETFSSTVEEAKAACRPTPFTGDRYFSPQAMSSTILSTRLWLNQLEDYTVPLSWSSSPLGRWGLSIVNNLSNDFLMLWSHEVHGHGYRHRELGQGVKKYTWFDPMLWYGLPLLCSPVNGIGAATSPTKGSIDSIDQAILVAIAGNEANSVLSQDILLKNCRYEALDYRTYVLYFKAFTNLLGYIAIHSKEQAGDDVDSYLKKMDQKYPSLDETKRLTIQTLRHMPFWIYFFNPILYTSVWSYYSYIFTGEQTTTLPRFNFNHCAYLPIVRSYLTPFGVSYALDQYLNIGHTTFLLGTHMGTALYDDKKYTHFLLKTDRLLTFGPIQLDVLGHLWQQPVLHLDKNPIILVQPSYWGFLVGMHPKIQCTAYVGIHGTLLYKTAGFAEGEEVTKGFKWRVGVTLATNV